MVYDLQNPECDPEKIYKLAMDGLGIRRWGVFTNYAITKWFIKRITCSKSAVYGAEFDKYHKIASDYIVVWLSAGMIHNCNASCNHINKEPWWMKDVKHYHRR